MILFIQRPWTGIQHTILTPTHVEPVTHSPMEINEIFIPPNIENLMQNNDTLNTSPVTQADEAELSLENALLQISHIWNKN